MSRLRARCPVCNSYTAVATEGRYECHVCGRAFGAGLVRVPRAWGRGGDAMEEAANLPLAFPETGVVVERTLGEQTLALASDLPDRPLVLGGCCCVHVGAVEGLVARHERVGLEVDRENEPALRLYARHGFEELTRERFFEKALQ